MAGGKKGSSGAGETSKKASGQARKAEAAAAKLAAEEAKKEAVEADEWTKGTKSNAKKEAEAAKKAELARKKAEKEALLIEEEKSLPTKPAPKKSKAPVKKPAKGLDLAQLGSDDDEGGKKKPGIVASNIDDALDALDLDAGAGTKIDRHPERRRKAAYAAFEERRLAEMESDGSGQGLRLNQKKERIRKEFEKSPENPFNQVSVDYDATKDDVAQLREAERIKTEARLTARD